MCPMVKYTEPPAARVFLSGCPGLSQPLVSLCLLLSQTGQSSSGGPGELDLGQPLGDLVRCLMAWREWGQGVKGCVLAHPVATTVSSLSVYLLRPYCVPIIGKILVNEIVFLAAWGCCETQMVRHMRTPWQRALTCRK